MRLKFFFVGKTRNQNLRAEINKYFCRLRHYLPVDLHEIKVLRPGSKENPPALLKRQAPQLLGLLHKDNFYRVILAERGQALNTIDFADWLAKLLADGRPGVSFYVGGPFGLATEVCREADLLLSLSPLTLTHELSRVVLLEQLYRAMTIIKGEPYNY